MNKKKIYIEAGAHDGVFQSRSLQFKDNDEYFGLLIEPHFDTYQQCCHNRQNERCKIYNCALVSFSYKDENIKLGIHSSYTAMNSTIKAPNEKYIDTVDVKARTLQSILDENDISFVEYFFLDAEGYEREILNGIDFKKISFNNIEVECHYPFLGLTQKDEIDQYISFFEKNNYKLFDKILGDGLPKLIFVPN
jgi:FkbM family methyltransferase